MSQLVHLHFWALSCVGPQPGNCELAGDVWAWHSEETQRIISLIIPISLEDYNCAREKDTEIHVKSELKKDSSGRQLPWNSEKVGSTDSQNCGAQGRETHRGGRGESVPWKGRKGLWLELKGCQCLRRSRQWSRGGWQKRQALDQEWNQARDQGHEISGAWHKVHRCLGLLQLPTGNWLSMCKAQPDSLRPEPRAVVPPFCS